MLKGKAGLARPSNGFVEMGSLKGEKNVGLRALLQVRFGADADAALSSI
jgi:hypothetical protein